MSAPLSFSDTAIAFESKSIDDLKRAHMLFKAIGYNWLVQMGPGLVQTAFALRLPVEGLIRKTIFKQFCGGTSIEDCENTINDLWNYRIGTILDYSVEGEEKEEVFDATAEEIINTIKKAAGNEKIPFSVFKVTGIARFHLLFRINSHNKLEQAETEEYNRVKERLDRICQTAQENNVRIFIDAEESWIQDAIDSMARAMMLKYNKEKAIVYNTIQLYRHDRFEFLKRSFSDAKINAYHLGVKLVRGAYMEKERERANDKVYDSPIQPNKKATDNDYNEALRFCIKHIGIISTCAGTHNEESTQLLVDLMKENNIAPNDQRIYFSQLLGMSDHLSYNLSHAGYNVAKYVPYGPVKAVLPYLIRRAQENTSVKGQTGRELSLIKAELKRRGEKK